MNIIELEEGLRNLIATGPAMKSGENAKLIAEIKNIIEAHKAFAFRVEEYENQDILKIGLTGECSRVELNLTSYVCQILQERGINIMLYVPKYASVYNQEISKYVDDVTEIANEPPSQNEEIVYEPINDVEPQEEQPEEKYVVVEKQPDKEAPQPEASKKPEKVQPKTMQSNGRDYLMELLRK